MVNELVVPDEEKIRLNKDQTRQFITAMGMPPVKLRPRQKDAFPDWEPATHPTKMKPYFRDILVDIEKNDLNVGAQFCEEHVDVDIDTDTPEVNAALDFFLPPTTAVWGRAGRPKGHRYYSLDRPYERGLYQPILRRIAGIKIEDKDYAVEVRGGEAKTATMTMMPGSIHPSGEVVEWHKSADMSVSTTIVKASKLIKSIRLAIAASLMVPYWVEGQRNHMNLAFAGLIWRIRTAALAHMRVVDDADIPEDFMLVTYEDAEKMMEFIAEEAGDDKNDIYSRKLSAKSTWRKLDADDGNKITGSQTLIEAIGKNGEEIVGLLYRLLSDDPSADIIERVAGRFAIWYGTDQIIDLEQVKRGDAKVSMNMTAFELAMGREVVRSGAGVTTLPQIVRNSKLIPQVNGFGFNPAEELVYQAGTQQKVNLFRGFDVPPADDYSKADDDMMKYYLREVLANGDQERYDWIRMWFADMLQNPAKKPKTSLLLIGEMGAGKTFIGEKVIGAIIGGSHFGQTSSTADFADRFNSILEKKILLQCDESEHSNRKSISTRLKSIITEDTISIERKGLERYNIENHTRIFFTSNDEYSAGFIDPSEKERRFSVGKVSDKHAEDMDFWQAMHEWAETRLPNIHRWFLDQTIDKMLISRPFKSAEKRLIQRGSAGIEEAWLRDVSQRSFPFAPHVHRHWSDCYHSDNLAALQKDAAIDRTLWPNRVRYETLVNDLNYFIRSNRMMGMGRSASSVIEAVVGRLSKKETLELEYFDKDGKIRESVTMYEFPDREHLLERLID